MWNIVYDRRNWNDFIINDIYLKIMKLVAIRTIRILSFYLKWCSSYILAPQAPFKVEQKNSNKKLANEKLASAS